MESIWIAAIGATAWAKEDFYQITYPATYWVLGKVAETSIFHGVGLPELVLKPDFQCGHAIAEGTGKFPPDDANDMQIQVQFQFYCSLRFALNIFGLRGPCIKKKGQS